MPTSDNLAHAAGERAGLPGTRWSRWTPVHVGLLAGLVALAFVLARLVIAADGDVSRFVVAGDLFTDATTVEPELYVFDSAGSDGQFFWRLAVDPFDRSLDRAHGVELDQGIRTTRVTYPALASVGAVGQPGLVVWSLVVVNVVAFGALGGFAAAFARDRGLAPVTGLVAASATGLVIAMARDLGEVTMIACLLGGMVALGRHRYGWASVGFAAAVLTHEQAVYVVAAYGVYRLAGFVRARRPGLGRADLPWVVSAGAFVAVQGAMAPVVGGVPVLTSGDNNVTLPFVGLVPELAARVAGDFPAQEALFFPQLMLAVVTVAVALAVGRGVASEDRWLLWALIGGVVLAVTLSRNVWAGPAELRQVVLVPTLAWLVILASGRLPPGVLLGATGLVWAATVGLRVTVI